MNDEVQELLPSTTPRGTATAVRTTPAEPGRTAGASPDLSAEALIEEVSIDGMCGVY